MSKNFPFTGGGGSLDKNFFFHSEHVSSQIWCQKFFPLPVGGGVPQEKNVFPSLNMYQAKSGVKTFSLYHGGGSLDKKYFSQSEHVSSQFWCQKFIPLRWWGGRGSLDKIFFFHSEHVSSQIWCQKIFPLPVGGGGAGGPLTKNFFFHSEHVSSQILCQKFFPLLRPGTPPSPVWTN